LVRRSLGARPILFLASGAVALLIGLPLVALLGRALAPDTFLPALQNPGVGAALTLSMWTSFVSLALAVAAGTPLAYVLARVPFRGRALLDALVEVPIVLPPAVAGIALLMAFGRRGLVGAPLAAWGISLAFTPWAVIIAQCFVAIPFYVRTARTGFAGVDPELELAARVDGATPWDAFRHVTVPLAFPSLFAGAILCWARAIGEFGATIMFAGSFRGRTQTMPLAIYAFLESDLNAALALGALLVLASLLVLALVRWALNSREEAALPRAVA
jgi:molybdate transport system permease protein